MAADPTVKIRLALEGAQQVRAQLQGVTQNTDRVADTLRRIGQYGAAAFAFAGLNQSLSGLAQLADQVQQVDARLKLAVGSAQAFAQAQAFAYRVAAQTGAGYESIAALYGKLAQAASGYGLTQQQVASTTEATALALKVSGASAAQASSVVLQFSQALGSGVLRGDEFNSILENGSRLAKALADGLGLPIGRLRELAEQGLLTTDVITKALESQREKLAAEAAQMPKTIGQALSEVRDEFGRTVNAANQSIGATSALANAISALARNMDAIAGGAAVVTMGALAAALTRAGIAAKGYVADALARIAADRQAAISAQAVAANEVAKAQAMVASAQAAVANASGMARLTIVQTQLVPAQQRLAAAQAALNAAMASGTGIARGLSSALSFIGGPLGLILSLLTAGATAWAIWGDRAKTAADKARDAIDRARDAAERLRKEQQFGAGDIGALREGIAALEQRERLLTESVTRAGSKAAAQELARVRAELAQRRKDLADMEAKERALTGGGPTELGQAVLGKGFERFLDQYRAKIDPLAAALKELREQAEKAGIALTSPKYRQAEALVRQAFAKKGEALAATRLPKQVERYDAELGALKAALKTAEEVIETSFRARLIKEDAYWQAKGAMQRQALDLEARDLAVRIADQERLIAQLQAIRPRNAAQRAEIADRLREAQARLAELRVQMNAIDGRRMVVDLEVQTNIDRVRQELDDLKASLREMLAEGTGQMTPEMLRAQVEREFRDTLQRLAGDAEGEQLVARLIDVEVAKRQLAEMERAWQLALETMRNTERSIDIEQQQGLITTAEAQQRIAEAHRQAADAMDALLPKMEKIAQVLGPEAVARVQAWKTELASVKIVVDPVAASLNTSIKSAFEDMFVAIGQGAKSAKDAFADFARSVLGAMQRILAQRFAEQLFGSLGKGGGGGGIGGFLARLFKFNAGGPVPGSGVGDTVPAMLTPGEYVIRRAAVQRFGVAFLDAINGLRLPPGIAGSRLAFASGGLVPETPPPQPQGQGQGVRIVNAIDPSVTHDHLQTPAGERVILNIIGRNARAVRAALQG